jgi:hypothetical protein
MKSVKFYQTYCRSCKKVVLFAPTGKMGRTISNKTGEWYDCCNNCTHSILLIKKDDNVHVVEAED